MGTALLDRTEFQKMRLRHGAADYREDIAMLRRGVLDPRSFREGYRAVRDPVEVRTTDLVPKDKRVDPVLLVTDPAAYTEPMIRTDGTIGDAAFEGRQRYYREIRRSHNLQLNIGKAQIQVPQSFGDVGTDLNGLALTGSGTPTSTTWTTSGSMPTATAGSGNAGLQGHILYVANSISGGAFTNPVFGVILSNTDDEATLDQWYAIPVTGGAGTTPSSGSAGLVLPGGSWSWWVALSTYAGPPSSTDVNRTADGLWGDGTATDAATELTTDGMARAYVGQGASTAPTLPASGQIALNNTWTYTGATSLTIQTVVLFNALAAAGCLPLLETNLSTPATINTSGQTIVLQSWYIQC